VFAMQHRLFARTNKRIDVTRALMLRYREHPTPPRSRK
jgi:hypothetical protein